MSLRPARHSVHDALTATHAGNSLNEADVAWLSAALRYIAIRDYASSRMIRDRAEQHLELCADMVRRAAPEAFPAPGSLLASTCWQTGHGALANLALDRALEADPGYSMAHLLRSAFEEGLSPVHAYPPLTPAQTAAWWPEEHASRDARETDA